MPCNSCGNPFPEVYPKSWYIETLCKLCRQMNYKEIKDNKLIKWYTQHLQSDYHYNRNNIKEKESAKKELERIG